MKRKGKDARAAGAAFFAVALILLLLAGALLPHHHDAGEDCPLCAMTAGRGLFALVFLAFACLAGRLVPISANERKTRFFAATPIHQKVKLLN